MAGDIAGAVINSPLRVKRQRAPSPYAVSKFTSGGGDYSFPELWNGFLLITATIPALVAWLIWALLA